MSAEARPESSFWKLAAEALPQNDRTKKILAAREEEAAQAELKKK